MKHPFEMISGIKVLINEPMVKHTSFHLGGNAMYLVKVFSLRALKKLLYLVRKKRMKYCVIGAGSNILVSDKGFPGVIIKLYGVFRKIERDGDIFQCGSGLWIDSFLRKAKDQGYGGAEFLAGIPGTIGGAIKGNAGAFGKSIADILTSITVLTERIVVQNLAKKDIGFSYRQTHISDRIIVLMAQLKLKRRRRKDIVLDLERNLAYREKKQPAGFSAGSYFKNMKPLIAGKLIEECNLKGLRVGDAEVSQKHANFIVNRGHARASDVLRLAAMIKRKVKATTGVLLKEEVRLLK